MPRDACVAFILLCCFFPDHPACAQEVPMEGTLPDSIVVTASRRAEDVRLTGRRTTVWTARDLQDLPVSAFDELLRTVGGVEVRSRGGFGVQSDLTMRGSTFNGVLLLLDGMRLNDPMTGHFLADLPVPLSEIARIEVLRGPAAAVYGPDALGGVVQLFTYAGLRASAAAAERVEGEVTLQGGSFELYHVDAAIRRLQPRTSVTAASAWQGSSGMPVLDAEGRPVRSAAGAVRTDFRRRAHTAAVTQRFRRAALLTRVGIDRRDFGAFHFYTPFPSDTAREATATYWAQARLGSHAATPTSWQVQAAARQHEDTYIYNPQTPANRHTSRHAALQAQASRDFGRALLLTGGTSAMLRGIDSNNLGRHQDASAGLFAHARWQARRGLTFNLHGRLDYDPGFGLEGTPQFSMAYNRPRFTLRSGLSRAVRAPTYVERYFNTTLPRPRGGSLGNPDLLPETAWAYEAGVDLYPASGFSLHATAFLQDMRNLIDYAMLTPADTVFLARNLLHVQTRGLEVDAELHRPIGPADLQLTATYTRLQADLGTVAEGVTYKYVLTNARHLVQTAAALDWGACTLGLQGLWKEPLQGDAYGVVNVRLAYHWTFGRQRLTLGGEARNLFDVRYAEVFDAPMPGRWWLFGARLAR